MAPLLPGPRRDGAENAAGAGGGVGSTLAIAGLITLVGLGVATTVVLSLIPIYTPNNSVAVTRRTNATRTTTTIPPTSAAVVPVVVATTTAPACSCPAGTAASATFTANIPSNQVAGISVYTPPVVGTPPTAPVAALNPLTQFNVVTLCVPVQGSYTFTGSGTAPAYATEEVLYSGTGNPGLTIATVANNGITALIAAANANPTIGPIALSPGLYQLVYGPTTSQAVGTALTNTATGPTSMVFCVPTCICPNGNPATTATAAAVGPGMAGVVAQTNGFWTYLPAAFTAGVPTGGLVAPPATNVALFTLCIPTAGSYVLSSNVPTIAGGATGGNTLEILYTGNLYPTNPITSALALPAANAIATAGVTAAQGNAVLTQTLNPGFYTLAIGPTTALTAPAAGAAARSLTYLPTATGPSANIFCPFACVCPAGTAQTTNPAALATVAADPTALFGAAGATIFTPPAAFGGQADRFRALTVCIPSGGSYTFTPAAAATNGPNNPQVSLFTGAPLALAAGPVTVTNALIATATGANVAGTTLTNVGLSPGYYTYVVSGATGVSVTPRITAVAPNTAGAIFCQ